MKYYELKACTKYLSTLGFLNSIVRVDDDILRLSFNKKIDVYADMRKGSSTLFMCDDFKRSKTYRSPFDITLAKRFTNVLIKSIDTLKNNRVLVLHVEQKNSYKIINSILLLEFTGRNTNAIILDENETIQEALRHIDISKSYRSVKVGRKLEQLPPHILKEEPKEIGDINYFLYQIYDGKKNTHLQNLKKQKRATLLKKIEKLSQLLTNLEKEEDVLSLSQELHEKGILLLSNRYTLNSYDKNFELINSKNEIVKITIDESMKNIQEAIDDFFLKAKKLKQRAKSIYIESENLKEKYEFLKRLDKIVENANSEEEINILLPKQSKNDKKHNESSLHESFFIEGFKVMIGKNEKGNIALLKNSKKNDIWLHMKGFPSAHVIIKTDKNSLPIDVLNYAAKLCVDLSGFEAGKYIVDYTKRLNVKIQNGANVNYFEHKSIHIDKE